MVNINETKCTRYYKIKFLNITHNKHHCSKKHYFWFLVMYLVLFICLYILMKIPEIVIKCHEIENNICMHVFLITSCVHCLFIYAYMYHKNVIISRKYVTKSRNSMKCLHMCLLIGYIMFYYISTIFFYLIVV